MYSMEQISMKDREILREIAKRHLEYANSPENEMILKKWDALAKGRKETPTVRLLFSNFTHEVITPRLRCEGEAARKIEAGMLWTLCGRDLFDDDTPISPTYDVSHVTWAKPFGIMPERTRSKDAANGYHIDPVIEDLEEDIDKLRGGSFGYDEEATKAKVEQAQELFGDILPVRMVMGNLSGGITNPLVHLMGMEQYYCAMYDYPDELHEVMDMATKVYEGYYDMLEEKGLLLPTHGISPLAQESFAFNNELPTENITSTKQVWGFLESQETHAVSPKTYGEFVYPYQDRLVQRYGLLSYGCCERVDAIWEDYLSKWSNLRKLSVSPFNNERQVGDYLRGTNVIYYSKPRADVVVRPGTMDEDAVRSSFKEVCECASGCLFEVAQREVGTIYGDVERGRRYVQILKECIDEYWKP